MMEERAEIRFFGAEAIRRTVGIAEMIEPVEKALAAYSAGHSLSPPINFIKLENGGEVHLKSGYSHGSRLFVSKIASMVPENLTKGLHSSDGLMLVCSAETGFPIALFHDRKYLTDIRTAAVGAVAARFLAAADAEHVGVLGTGGQAVLQMVALSLVRPVRRVSIWGRSEEKTERAVAKLRDLLPSARVFARPSAEHVVKSSSIVVTTTASTEPIVYGEWLTPGQHLAALGADDTTKAELDANCFQRANFVACDSRVMSAHYGEVARWTADGSLGDDTLDCELGELVTGDATFRRKSGDITISKHIGIGIEDLFAASEFLARSLS